MNSIPDILHHLEMEMQQKPKDTPKSKLKMFKVDKMLHEKIQIMNSSEFSNSKLISPMKFDVQKIYERRKHQNDEKVKESESREIPQRNKEIDRSNDKRSVYAFGSSTPRMADSFTALSSSPRRSVQSSPINIPKQRVAVERKSMRTSMYTSSSSSSSRSSVSETPPCITSVRLSLIPRIRQTTIEKEKNSIIQKTTNSNMTNSRSLNTYHSYNMRTPPSRKSTSVREKDTSESKIKGNESQIKGITSEEQAKAVLSERRKSIREEHQRKYDLENLRIEEQKNDLKKQDEITQQRNLEDRVKREQQIELEKLAKKVEAEKLSKKIKAEKVLADKIRIEETEKKRKIELAALEIEKYEERENRRRRVEIIMNRTRAKNVSIKTNDENKNIEANR